MEELTEDLLLELWKKRQVLVIRCSEDAGMGPRGVSDKDQAALELYNAVKELAGFDGKGPLVILRTLKGKEE